MHEMFLQYVLILLLSEFFEMKKLMKQMLTLVTFK